MESNNLTAEVAVIKNDVKWIRSKIEEDEEERKELNQRVSNIENQLSRMFGYAAGAGAIAAIAKDVISTLI